MNDSYDVIVYGTVCLDAIWRVDQLAPPGGYEPIIEERKMIGGEAANTAIALTRWGVRVALVGNALGDDEDGRHLRDLFARDVPALDLRFVATQREARTPTCVCIATPDGNRTMYGTGFSEMQCPALDPKLARQVGRFTLDPNAWNAGLRACKVAADAGAAITAMDYTRDSEVSRAATVNLTSRDHLGLDRTLDDLAATAAQLRDTTGRTVVVTVGQQGCLVAAADCAGADAVHYPAFVAPAMVDSTGAGDVFRAGLLYGQVQGWDLAHTVRFASAAAALNCGAMGGWGGVQPVEAIEAFAASAPLHSG